MLYFKSCPKCQTGTVEHRQDPYGELVQCLHCGFLRDLDEGETALEALGAAKVRFQEAAATAEEAAA